MDYETPPPYLEAIGDPMDADGYVTSPGAGHGLSDHLGLHRGKPSHTKPLMKGVRTMKPKVWSEVTLHPEPLAQLQAHADVIKGTAEH